MKKTNIKVNLNENTITIPSAFAKKAEIFGTPEFRELMEAMREVELYTRMKPEIKIEKKAKKSVSLDEPKEKKIRPSYKMMFDFIKSVDDEKGTQMEEFKRQREMVRFGTTKYNATLAWFLNTYANKEDYKEAFIGFSEMTEATAPEAENTTAFPQAENF